MTKIKLRSRWVLSASPKVTAVIHSVKDGTVKFKATCTDPNHPWVEFRERKINTFLGLYWPESSNV